MKTYQQTDRQMNKQRKHHRYNDVYMQRDLQTDIYINPQTKYWAKKKPRCID